MDDEFARALPGKPLAQRAWAVKRVLELSFTHRMFGFDSVPSLDVEGRAFVTDVAVATSSLDLVRTQQILRGSGEPGGANSKDPIACTFTNEQTKGSFAPDMSTM